MGFDDYDDDCFTKPGAIPFKWEIKPGVPKIQAQQQKHSPPPSQPHSDKHLKLKPPPSGSIFLPPLELHTRTRSFRSPSASRTRSELWRFDQPNNILTRRSEAVWSAGCFMSPLLRRKPSSKSKRGSGGARTVHVLVPESEPDYTSDLETLERWSLSSRKTLLSPFRDSPTSTSMSSYSSYRSSPRPVSDAEWAGFGLF